MRAPSDACFEPHKISNIVPPQHTTSQSPEGDLCVNDVQTNTRTVTGALSRTINVASNSQNTFRCSKSLLSDDAIDSPPPNQLYNCHEKNGNTVCDSLSRLFMHEAHHMGDIGANDPQAWGFSLARCARLCRFDSHVHFASPNQPHILRGGLSRHHFFTSVYSGISEISMLPGRETWLLRRQRILPTWFASRPI